ncbi:hypothetical protein OWM54_05605 [Myxococcus sp. MISCRS1]|uniref:hypothetical protein n=1 Tax=Myxococcus sp. MISCRS1 TaxID=2996786 RepID=UPI00226F28C4|nr:hypothetical protein [Myxococcus sp. MISCRS1]MCY0996608.1 hypothetical protein [Myxococcus sp. MISCRS1]
MRSRRRRRPPSAPRRAALRGQHHRAATTTLTYLFDATSDTWSSLPGASATGTSPIRFTVHPQGPPDLDAPTYKSQAFWDWMFALQRL